MDYSQYENYGFDRVSAFNLSTGYQERSYQAHWHSYGEFVLVGPGDTNIFMVNQRRYELVEGDFLLVWPMEMHSNAVHRGRLFCVSEHAVRVRHRTGRRACGVPRRHRAAAQQPPLPHPTG